ncbi:MAG: endonuclease V [Candidatus Aenigmatarchaeota archaeon]|nr:MAG: endonuclease V [Candidatus Aenigmarchaeota archaeon]
MELSRLKSIQERFVKKLVLEDRIGKLELVAGFDQAFRGKQIISAGVLCRWPDFEPVEMVTATMKEKMPYIPGYLSFREGPAILKAYKKLKLEPDLILIDGNGILHPRKLGLASWVGIKLEKPTIGVAKSLLCGKVRGEWIFVNGEKRGYYLKSKRLYISPGNLISLETAVKLIKLSIKNRLPEPLRLADRYAKDKARVS